MIGWLLDWLCVHKIKQEKRKKKNKIALKYKTYLNTSIFRNKNGVFVLVIVIRGINWVIFDGISILQGSNNKPHKEQSIQNRVRYLSGL